VDGDASLVDFLLLRLAGRLDEALLGGGFDKSCMNLEDDLVIVSWCCLIMNEELPYPLFDMAESPPVRREALVRTGSGGELSPEGWVFCLLDLRGVGGLSCEGLSTGCGSEREGALRFLEV
jgi:hypothetical protein